MSSEVLDPLEGGHTSSRHTGDHNFTLIVEIILLIQIVKLLEGISGSPEEEVSPFVVDGSLSVSLMFDSIAVYGEDFGPIMKDRILGWIGGEESFPKETFLLFVDGRSS